MPENTALRGVVFAISRGSGEDGPGIRTTVFLKGCPLSCIWCHSPESQGKTEPQIAFYESRCIHCGACVQACPKGLHTVTLNERSFRLKECDNCGKCLDLCPSRALEMVGKLLTVNEVLSEVIKDIAYYQNSSGGVTFSGGESTMQPEFLAACLKKCKEAGIHTALDTCGFFQWQVLKNMLDDIDLFLFDLKHTDSAEHQRLTGVDNDLILSNLMKINQQGKSIWIRVPLIPGINDSIENLSRVAEIAGQLDSVEKVSLLPYNTAAGAKYEFIQQSYRLVSVLPHTEEKLQEFRRIFTSRNIMVELSR